MSKNRVFVEMDTDIETALRVQGHERESDNLNKFLVEHHERFCYNQERKRYFINSFYPSFPSKAWDRFIGGTAKIVQDGKRVPLQADIVVTGKCHCRCWHCFRIKDQRMDLDISEIEKCFQELYEMGTATVGITGGEPMLRNDIRDIISMIPDGIEGQLYTTGHNISKEFVEFIKKTNLTRVIISLDHYKEDISCEMRHYDKAFNEAVAAIKLLVEAGIYTAVTVCITEKLLEQNELENYFNFVSSLKPDEIRIIMPIPQGNLEGKNVSNIYSEAVKFVKLQKKLYEKDTTYPSILNFCEFESAYYMGCSAGANYISVNNDGLVTPCVAVPLSFGNIKDNSLKNIFYSMEEYFPKSGRICYGKVSGRVIERKDIDTTITPLGVEISKEIAGECNKSSKRAQIFECFNCMRRNDYEG